MRAYVHAVVAAAILVAASPRLAASPLDVSAQFDTLIGDAKAAMLADPTIAIAKASAAKAIAARDRDLQQRIVMRATADWLCGEAYARLNDMAKAAPIISGALTTISRIAPGTKLHAELLLSSGSIHTANADVADALSDYQKAHMIFAKLGEERNQSKALQAIASLYGGANDYETALKYYDQALAGYRADPNFLLSLYNNRGNALRELHRYAEAERQYRDALKLAEQIDSPMLQAIVEGNIAETRLAVDDVRGADHAIDAAMRLSMSKEGAGFRKWLAAIAARAAYQGHDLGRAQTLIQQRFDGEDFAKAELLDREAHQTAFDIYRATGRNDLALLHLVTLKRLDDEATKLARSTNAALMAARFDFANQALKIAKLRQDELRRTVAFEQDRARTQRYVLLGTVGATAIVIAMLLFALFTSRKARERVQSANADLAVTNTALGKALAAKTEFLATTSHEIRTPLNGILGMTQVMLADAKLREDQRDRLTIVHDAGVTMRALVDDILDVAKMETGNLTVEDAPFDLEATVDGSIKLWEDQARAKGVAFVRDTDDCPGMICGDAARVRQIMFNLLANALKFTAVGSVTLSIRRAGERYRIAIADTGVGIPADKREAIFESFRQADTSTTRQFGGTGLGLSICRNLARAMGGDVTVESVVGKGSVFTVDLPLTAADCPPTPVEQPDTPALLIVDRNPITRSMLRTLLLPQANAVVIAGSIDDAVDHLREGRVFGILVDDATVRAGDDVHRDLARLTDVAGAAVPVTLLWPVSAEAERDALMATGIASVIAKPVSGAALVAAMFPASPAKCDPPLVSQAA